MKAHTLKALQGSIAKWEAIVAGTGEDDGVDNCPLCLLFHPDKNPGKRNCGGCPVQKATGKAFCNGSPYRECFPNYEERAQRELAFLKSLLPAQTEG